MIPAVELYADDTTIYDQQFEVSILERKQLSLNSLYDWCRDNGMVFKTEKTKVTTLIQAGKIA